MVGPLQLSDSEIAALVALQVSAEAPPPDSPVWSYLVTVGLVEIDRRESVHVVRLSPAGREYEGT